MVGCQVASGLSADPGRFTEVIVVLLAASAVGLAASTAGAGRAAAGFAAAAVLGYAAELVGVGTGWPFGEYEYTDALHPRLFGVPVVVAAAWAGMGLAAYAVARAAVPGRRWLRLAVGALALTAWDLFLDPQMVRQGVWVWREDGPYHGIPWSNFAGWLLVSLAIMAVLDRVAGAGLAGRGLLWLYTVMAVMETLGFAVVFRPPDPLVATVGGIGMGIFVVLAWRRRWQR